MALALRYGQREMSYAQLEQRANQFAAYLHELGVGTGDTVAICLPRSFELIVAALGAMRVGAAYLPLDPAWPDSRLRFALEDSSAAALVAPALLSQRIGVKLHRIDPVGDSSRISNADVVAAQLAGSDPQSLAYVIYTSGTSGRPKGVEITHANLAHLVRWHCEAFAVTERDRASHLAGLGFDAAVWEIWPYLAAGATLCLVDDSVRTAQQLLKDWLIREGITIAFVPTVTAAPLIAAEWPADAALRVLLTGGDALQQYPSSGLPFVVVNNYGPTECTVVATSTSLVPGASGTPPIGHAIAGAEIYVLGENGSEVAPGEAGEICIGGDGVGRGYRNLPELTAKYFPSNPYSNQPGARMYRTGDRGVRASDGQIFFRGRLDNQVKIRGQRVELDEIANTLAQYPAVSFATVIAVDHSGEKQLAAYVVPRHDSPVPSTNELQNHLLRSLPDYMVPALFLRLSSVPLSANGKVDLRLLPSISDCERLPSGSERRTVSETESRLMALVRRILGNDSVGPEDSFFLAGGHSLLGMQLLLRLRETFSVDLTLRQLFEAPTVEQLAVVIDETLKHATHLDRTGLFWIQSRMNNLAELFGDEYPLYSVGLTPEDMVPLGKQPAMAAVAACLVRKVREAQPKGPYRVGGVCLGGILAYEVALQLRAAGEEVPFLVMMSSPNPAKMPNPSDWHERVRYFGYALKRATRLGLGKTAKYAVEHVRRKFKRASGLGMGRPHQIAELSARAYQPPQYDGPVLLVLASDRPPHNDFAAAWRNVAIGHVQVEYIDCHARELLDQEFAPKVARAILARLGNNGVGSAPVRVPPAPSAEREPRSISQVTPKSAPAA
jgi:amino acid adenylation domain-containing protein